MWLSIWSVAALQTRNSDVYGVGIIYFAGSYFVSSAKEDLEDTREFIRLGKKPAYTTFNEAAIAAEKEWQILTSEKAQFSEHLQNAAAKLGIKS